MASQVAATRGLHGRVRATGPVRASQWQGEAGMRPFFKDDGFNFLTEIALGSVTGRPRM